MILFTKYQQKLLEMIPNLTIRESLRKILRTFDSHFSADDHTHGSITNDGKLGSTEHKILVTGTSGVITTLNTGTEANQVLMTTGSAGQVTVATMGTGSTVPAVGNHVHGNITNVGKIGAAADIPIVTGTDGILQAGAFGISNTNFVKVDSADVADDEYARFTANGLEGRSASELAGDIKDQFPQAITDNHVVTVDQDGAADNDFAKFTANGLEGRSYSEVKQDLDLEVGVDVSPGVGTAENSFLVSGADPFSFAEKLLADTKTLLHASPGAIGNTAAGTLQCKLAEIIKASSGTLTAQEMTGTQVNNLGQTLDVTLTLDPAATGLHFMFVAGTTVAKYYRFDPNASDCIYLDGAKLYDGKYVGFASIAAGNACFVQAFQTATGVYDWHITTVSGSLVAEA